MSIENHKAQARRLQTFTKTHPETAAALASGKHAPCLEAIAAIEGFRNWNTLQASLEEEASLDATQVLKPAELLPSARSYRDRGPAGFPMPNRQDIFGGLRQGQVQFSLQRNKNRQLNRYGESFGVVDALQAGYVVTILQADESYSQLARAFNGGATSAGRLKTDFQSWDADILAINVGGLKLTQLLTQPDTPYLSTVWDELLQVLRARSGPGYAIVADDVSGVQAALGSSFKGLTAFAREASVAGTVFNFLSDSQDVLNALGADLEADQA
jgi:hypothetical protein